MKFTVGFIAGAMVGRPVIRFVSSRIRLAETIQARVAFVIYKLGDQIAGEKFHANYQQSRNDR